MNSSFLRRKAVIVPLAAVALAAGGAGAVAATSQEEAKKTETAILADAAKRLGVGADDLRKALSAAEDAQLDAAVKAGRLTQERADAIKARRKADGTVLRLGPGGRGRGHHGPGGRGMGFGIRHAGMAAAAKALGLTEAELHEQLHDGKTLAQIAQAENKELADVKAAVKAATTKELDAAVKAGKLTDAQRDEILAGFDARFDEMANSTRPKRGRHGPGGRGMAPGGYGLAPGAAPEAPAATQTN